MRLIMPEDPGFLGSTSSLAILTETVEDTELVPILQSTAILNTNRTDLDITRIGSRRMKQALDVVELLRHFVIFEDLLVKYSQFEFYTSMIDCFVGECLVSVRTDLVGAGALESKNSLKATVERLFQNTCKSVPIPLTCTLEDFSQSFTGTMLRWETLAVFFTACGLVSCIWTSSHPAIQDVFKDQQNMLRQLLEASSACVSFCEDSGPLSDLGLWVHYEHVVLSCQVLGYTHYLVWNHMGATTNHIIAQGRHIDNESDDNCPPWLLEMRRRGVACAYVVDKLFCRLYGRPPRLSQRYCSIHIPLDVGTSQLVAEGFLPAALQPDIRAGGWDVHGPHEKSYLRCLVMCSKITEEALELSLGPSQDNLQSRAE
jgi:hypothetical protein